MKKKKSFKRFVPVFQPVNIQVIGVDGEGNRHYLPIVQETQYMGQFMRVFVRYPKKEKAG